MQMMVVADAEEEEEGMEQLQVPLLSASVSMSVPVLVQWSAEARRPRHCGNQRYSLRCLAQ